MAEANWPICLVFSTALTGFKNWRPPQDYNHPIPTPFTKCSHPVFAKRPSRSPNWLGPKRSRSSRSFRSHCWKGVHCRMVEIPPTRNNTRPLVFATLAGECRGTYWIARTIAYAFCKVCSHIFVAQLNGWAENPQAARGEEVPVPSDSGISGHLPNPDVWVIFKPGPCNWIGFPLSLGGKGLAACKQPKKHLTSGNST